MSDQDELRFAVAHDAALASGLEELRKPFPASTVGKLPRTTCKRCSDSSSKVCDQHTKRECAQCGNYMTTAHMHLDYVGHAEVTDRLLSVDPLWSWEPIAFDDAGGPLIRKGASGEWTMWIRLTVCGVTRLGVGSVSTGLDAEKQLIGDALRNAAMRFGVALDLWSKSELESAKDETPIAGPPPEPKREALRERVAALPQATVDRFLAWLDANQMPRKAAALSDDQLAKADEWVVFAESGLEHAAASAGQAATGDSQPSEGVSAPVPAANPESASTGELDRDAARAHAAAEYVKRLDAAQLLMELGARNVVAPRTKAEQRSTLADILFLDAEWQPPGQEALL